MISYFEFIFFISIGTIMFFKNHFLMILLILELMTISVILSLSLSSCLFDFFILMMVVMVLEGAFGLSTLVFSSRKAGADLFSKF